MKATKASKGVLTACKPRKEVLEGELDDAIFAADFGQLIDGSGPKVYSDAASFFRNTEPTPDLKAVCGAVFRALADKKETGQLIRLSTGFGGGKTHTLIALWHLAHHISDLSLGTELLPAAGRPKEVKVVAVDAAKAGIPIFGSHGKVKVQSLQGEIFWQLGEASALKTLGPADHHEASPDEGLISKTLGSGPLLILLDELVIYMAALSATGQGNFLSFLGKLISSITKRTQAVLVITDPGQQAAYAGVSAQLAAAITPAAVKLDEILGRKMTDFDPVGKQAARVIARRLFEKIDPTAAAQTSDSYHQLYARVREAHPELLPASAVSADYAKRIEECYPFHPRLIDSAKERLGPLPEFQRSRGVLRLFARIIRDIWDQKQSLELITAGDINWGSDRIRADLLQRLRREQFTAAVDADLEGHATELDDGKKGEIHYRVASAILLESLPRTEHSGLDPPELTLAILRTDEAGQEPSESLDRLVGACWHTYPMAGGRGWQFRFEPNVIKQIEQRAALVDLQEAKERVFTETQSYFAGPVFSLSSWPDRPKDVLERKDLQLVLCGDVKLAEQVCAYADTTDPGAPVPRRFRNAIVAIAPSPDGFNTAIEKARRLIAAEQIERDAKHGESHALVREQLNRIKPTLSREFKIQTCRAFDTVVRTEGVAGRLEEKYQVPDEEILSKPQGQKCLRSFLQDKDMIYPPGASLDPDRFLKNVLTGATPLPGQSDTYRLSDVHERFLSAPGLRLVPDASVVRQTIHKSLEQGKVVIRIADGSIYDNAGAVTGPEGQRRRVDGSTPSFTLRDDEFITRADSITAKLWLKVDPLQPIPPGPGPGPGPGPQLPFPPPPEAPTIIGTTWPDILKHAESRPLLDLTLDASTPASAETLAVLVQPLGADQLQLDVTVSGQLKSGGTASFEVSGVKPNVPIKPLESARTLFNAMAEGMGYGARLTLKFKEPGRSGVKVALEEVSEKPGGDIKVRATFGKPGGKQ
ncbi:MAG: DUF499 domain-containing protein [Thermodesulfobacteriota bacterium]|jgi:hypothetical protein